MIKTITFLFLILLFLHDIFFRINSSTSMIFWLCRLVLLKFFTTFRINNFNKYIITFNLYYFWQIRFKTIYLI